MVTIDQTRKKYHGRKAATYDEIRRRQRRWKIENETVERMLRQLSPINVLDCPVGTGRFLAVYRALGCTVLGIDASRSMINLARKKLRGHGYTTLEVGDATATDLRDRSYDTVVCVRFLDLIDEAAMRAVMRELCRVAGRAVILTIRLGPQYVNKSNTATHSGNKFMLMVRRLGWRVEESVPVLNAGWTIMRLGRNRDGCI